LGTLSLQVSSSGASQLLTIQSSKVHTQFKQLSSNKMDLSAMPNLHNSSSTPQHKRQPPSSSSSSIWIDQSSCGSL
jgi:hypothetical protein